MYLYNLCICWKEFPSTISFLGSLQSGTMLSVTKGPCYDYWQKREPEAKVQS